MKSKALYLGVSEPTKRLPAKSIAYALRINKVNRHLSKKMKKYVSKKSVKSLDEFFS